MRSIEPGISTSRSRDSGFSPADCPGTTSSLLPRLRAQARVMLAQFGREGFAKIFCSENLADFDLGAGAERCALHPLDGIIERFGVDQPEATDEFARKRERPFGRTALPALIFD